MSLRETHILEIMQKVAQRRIGLVVPTLGERQELLVRTLHSGRSAGADHILLVTRSSELGKALVLEGLIDEYCLDRELGLAAAIADGIAHLPADIGYVNWLGDDDLLTQDSLLLLRETLENGPKDIPFAFGRCHYIDIHGTKLFEVPTGRWAPLVMRIGPQLVSQPACLIRLNAFSSVGGLDTSLGWAFDLDLLIKLCLRRNPTYVRHHIASFRWHLNSLSVKSRNRSVKEAAMVRSRHGRGIFRIFLLTGPLVSRAIFYAGALVSTYARRQDRTPDTR